MKFMPALRRAAPLAAASIAAALLAACSAPRTVPAPVVAPLGRAEVPTAAPDSQPAPAEVAALVNGRVSQAATSRAYRADAASHIYAANKERIYKGKMPPLLYAIGVLQVDVDSRGNVKSLNWMRAPHHAPEVVAEIERTVRAAAPYPVPARMGHVIYTDTWLWHKSGRFQLDTLTEGQL